MRDTGTGEDRVLLGAGLGVETRVPASASAQSRQTLGILMLKPTEAQLNVLRYLATGDWHLQFIVNAWLTGEGFIKTVHKGTFNALRRFGLIEPVECDTKYYQLTDKGREAVK